MNWVRITVGKEKISHNSYTALPATDSMGKKFVINGIISGAHHGAQFCTLNIEGFFTISLITERKKEYMKIHNKYFDEEL